MTVFRLLLLKNSLLLKGLINFLHYISILSIRQHCNLPPFNLWTVSGSTNSSLNIHLSSTCCTNSVYLRWSHNDKRQFICTMLVLMYPEIQFFLWRNRPFWPRASSIFRLQVLRHTTLSRTPLDKWSARRRHMYLKTHDAQKRYTRTRRDSNPQSQQGRGRRPTLKLRGHRDRANPDIALRE